MDTFLLTSLFSIAISLLLLITVVGIAPHAFDIHIGHFVNFRVSRRAANVVAIVSAACLFILAAVILFGLIHPQGGIVYEVSEFFLGRRFAGTILGFLFGTLLIFWMRQLVQLGEDDPIGWTLRIEAMLLVALFALGGFSDVLGAMARRITGVSAGGVSLTFAVLSNGGRFEGAESDLPVDTQAGRKSIGALGFVAGMSDFIERDIRYVSLLKENARSAAEAREPDLSVSVPAALELDFVRKSIEPLASCLQGISALTQDEAHVTEVLSRVRPLFREVMAIQMRSAPSGQGAALARNIETRDSHFAEGFVQTADGLAGEVTRVYLSQTSDPSLSGPIKSACQPLLLQRCQQLVGYDLGDIASGRLAESIETCLKDPEARKRRVVEIQDALRGVLSSPEVSDQRPYMRLLYAFLTWRLGDYPLATEQLESWLRQNGQPADADLEKRWLVVRVRTSLAAIMEEWLKSQRAAPVLLLEDHLENLKKTIVAMSYMPPVTQSWKALTDKGFDLEQAKFSWPTWSGECKLAPPQPKTWTVFRDQLALAQAYLRQQMLYAYRAASHYDYFDSYALDVSGKVRSITVVDLSCFQVAEPEATNATKVINLLYAEILETYGEVQLANAARIHDIDVDAANERLKRARDSAKLGLEMVGPWVKSEKDESFGSALKSAGPQKATELKFLLQRVLRRAEVGLRQS